MASGSRLVDLTKQPAQLRGEWGGELVGITRVSPVLHAEVLRRGETLLEGTPRVDYETALVAAARHHEVGVLRVEDLILTEGDDVGQLERATHQVAPRLEVGPTAA